MEPGYHDLVVVGAGWHGLAAAKTFLQVHPSSKLLVLDASPSVGGVWASHRLYRGLKSNNLLGTYEFSDFPMDKETYGVKPGEHISGEVLHRYFERFAEHFKLSDKLQFNSRVEAAEHQQDGSWKLSVARTDESDDEEKVERSTVYTRKLIVATGLTSQPFIPELPGADSFGAPLFHAVDLCKHEEKLFQEGKRAVILGATKSAWDAAYSAASAGMQADMVIRESGHGPVWMAGLYVTPLKLNAENLTTSRACTWFSPCIWADSAGHSTPRWFLHQTGIGRTIVDAFWGAMQADIVQSNGFDSHPEVKKLRPWVNPFWIGSALGALNYEKDFFQYVKDGKIRVHVANVSSLSAGTVHLSNGESLETDLMICSTGWKGTPPMKFLPEYTQNQLGLPWGPDFFDEEELREIDKEVLDRFPRLKTQPVINPKLSSMGETAPASAPHPYRLTRFMVPHPLRDEHSLVFVGMVQSLKTAMIAQTQALWAIAYLDGKITMQPKTSGILDTEPQQQKPASISSPSDKAISKSSVDPLVRETALHTQFGKWRYPGGLGKQHPDFTFDTLPYVDMLLGDLGLPHRRKAGFFAELFQAYGPGDYRGIVDEWLRKQDVEV